MMDKSNFNQQGQTVHGPQTNVAGNIIQTTEPPPVPRQIPPPPQDFTGRDEELDDILNGFEQGVTIAGLRGLGGIGKTALAFVLAQKLRDRYPDGRLMVELKGTSTEPLPPAEAMAHVIRSYHPTIPIPEDESGLRGLYLSILDGKQALLLLDNAADDRQAGSLLPPATCGVLVTSRRKFTLPGLAAKDLGTLKPEKAVELLMKVWNSASPSSAPSLTDGALSEIASLCGHLPLALRAAGSFLANTPDLSPSEYAVQLRDERTRLERFGKVAVDLPVEASFSLSYQRLSKETAHVFRVMSVFPTDFDARAEEAVCKDEGNWHLKELWRWSLVEYKPQIGNETGRFHLHDLVRLFTKIRLDEEGDGVIARDAAQHRHAEYYKNILSTANDLYEQGGDKSLLGLDLFDREWTNIKAGQLWASGVINQNIGKKRLSKGSTTEEHTLSLANTYIPKRANLLYTRMHPREWIRWLDIALTAAHQLKDHNREVSHLINIGLAYSNLGNYHRAIQFYERALTIARNIGDCRGEGLALGNLGNTYLLLGEDHQAIKFLEQASTIQSVIKDSRGQSATLGNLGFAYSNLGKHRRAIKYLERALAISHEIEDRRIEGAILDHFGIAYSNHDEKHQAIKFHEQALEIAREIKDLRGEGDALFNMSKVLDKLGYHEQAIEYANAALTIREKIEDERAEKVHQQLAKWQGK